MRARPGRAAAWRPADGARLRPPASRLPAPGSAPTRPLPPSAESAAAPLQLPLPHRAANPRPYGPRQRMLPHPSCFWCPVQLFTPSLPAPSACALLPNDMPPPPTLSPPLPPRPHEQNDTRTVCFAQTRNARSAPHPEIYSPIQLAAAILPPHGASHILLPSARCPFPALVCPCSHGGLVSRRRAVAISTPPGDPSSKHTSLYPQNQPSQPDPAPYCSAPQCMPLCQTAV